MTFKYLGSLVLKMLSSNAFERKCIDKESMPSMLRERLPRHFVFICVDSPMYALEMFSLTSLTRVAYSAIQAFDNSFVHYEKLVTTFYDLFK